MKKEKPGVCKTTKKQRRQKLAKFKNATKGLGCKGYVSGFGESKPNIMTNQQRKDSGLELDPDLEKVPCDLCEKLSSDLRKVHVWKDIEEYWCKECIEDEENWSKKREEEFDER